MPWTRHWATISLWPTPEGDLDSIGSIVAVKDAEAMLALLHATRDAVVQAIDEQAPAAVKQPLAEFWSAHPDYQPESSGDCYAVEDEDFPFEDPLDCQVEVLQSSVASLLGSAE